MVEYGFCPHCETNHDNNFYINQVTEQDDDIVTVETNYRCRHCKRLYRYIEVYCLQECDCIPIYEDRVE